jgi:hypothetical protein
MVLSMNEHYAASRKRAQSLAIYISAVAQAVRMRNSSLYEMRSRVFRADCLQGHHILAAQPVGNRSAPIGGF